MNSFLSDYCLLRIIISDLKLYNWGENDYYEREIIAWNQIIIRIRLKYLKP